MATSSAYTSPTYAAIKTEFNALPRGLVYNQSFSFRIATHDEMVQRYLLATGRVATHDEMVLYGDTSLVVNEQRGQLLWTEFLNFCSSGRELHRYYCHHIYPNHEQAADTESDVDIESDADEAPSCKPIILTEAERGACMDDLFDNQSNFKQENTYLVLCKLLGQCTKLPIEPVSKRRKLESDREREQSRLEFIESERERLFSTLPPPHTSDIYIIEFVINS